MGPLLALDGIYEPSEWLGHETFSSPNVVLAFLEVNILFIASVILLYRAPEDSHRENFAPNMKFWPLVNGLCWSSTLLQYISLKQTISNGSLLIFMQCELYL